MTPRKESKLTDLEESILQGLKEAVAYKKREITKSSGNVFSDLGLEDSEDLMAKAKLAVSIANIIKKRSLTQKQAATLLGTDQSNISQLNKGSSLKNLTFDRLFHWLLKLDRDITITVKKTHRKRTHINVAA